MDTNLVMYGILTRVVCFQCIGKCVVRCDGTGWCSGPTRQTQTTQHGKPGPAQTYTRQGEHRGTDRGGWWYGGTDGGKVTGRMGH